MNREAPPAPENIRLIHSGARGPVRALGLNMGQLLSATLMPDQNQTARGSLTTTFDSQRLYPLGDDEALYRHYPDHRRRLSIHGVQFGVATLVACDTDELGAVQLSRPITGEMDVETLRGILVPILEATADGAQRDRILVVLRMSAEGVTENFAEPVDVGETGCTLLQVDVPDQRMRTEWESGGPRALVHVATSIKRVNGAELSVHHIRRTQTGMDGVRVSTGNNLPHNITALLDHPRVSAEARRMGKRALGVELP